MRRSMSEAQREHSDRQEAADVARLRELSDASPADWTLGELAIGEADEIELRALALVVTWVSGWIPMVPRELLEAAAGAPSEIRRDAQVAMLRRFRPAWVDADAGGSADA